MPKNRIDIKSLAYYKLRYEILRQFAYVDKCGALTYIRYCTYYRQYHIQVRDVQSTKDIHRLLFRLSLYKLPQSCISALYRDLRCLVYRNHTDRTDQIIMKYLGKLIIVILTTMSVIGHFNINSLAAANLF